MALSDRNKVVIDFEANTEQAKREIAAFRTSFTRAVKETSESGNSFYNVLTQLRIGLTQLGRGDIGGVPNLIKASVLMRGEGAKLADTLHVFGSALDQVGVKSRTAGEFFERFTQRLQLGSNGTTKTAQSIRDSFNLAGIEIEKDLLRPDAAFRQMLINLNRLEKGSAEYDATLKVLGVTQKKSEEAILAAGAAMDKTGTAFTAAGVAATGFAIVAVAAIIAVVVVVALLVKGMEGILAEAKQVGTKSKEDFEKFAKAVKSAGGEVTALDRALAQDLTRSAEQVTGAMDMIFIKFLREAGPGAIILLKEIANALGDLAPIANFVGEQFNLAFRGAAFAIEIARQSIKNLAADIIEFVENPSIVEFAIILGRNVAVAATQLPKDKPPPPATFDSKGGRSGGSGPKDITDAQLQVKLLKATQDEAQRGLNGTREAAQRLLDVTLELIAAETREANERLPNKGAARLAEVRQQQLKALEKYSEELNKVNNEEIKALDDLSKRINDQIIANVEEIQRQEDALRSHNDFVQEQLRQEADATARKYGILFQLQGTFFNKRIEAIRNQSQLEIGIIEQDTIRRQEDIAQQIDDLDKLIARDKTEEAQILASKKALNLKLIALEEEAEARKALIRRQSLLDQQRAQPNSNLNVLGPNINDALNSLGVVNAAIGQQTTFWQELRAAMGAYAQDLRDTLPSSLQLAVQAMQQLAAVTSASITGFLTGRNTLRQAVGSIVDALLAPYKRYAEIKAAIQFAEAAGDFAYGNIAGGVKHLAVGALWTGLAGLIGAAGSFIGGSGASAASAAAGGGTSTQQNNGPRIINQSTNPQPVQIILRVEEGIVAQKVANNYASNGTLRQIIRSDVGANDR